MKLIKIILILSILIVTRGFTQDPSPLNFGREIARLENLYLEERQIKNNIAIMLSDVNNILNIETSRSIIEQVNVFLEANGFIYLVRSLPSSEENEISSIEEETAPGPIRTETTIIDETRPN